MLIWLLEATQSVCWIHARMGKLRESCGINHAAHEVVKLEKATQE